MSYKLDMSDLDRSAQPSVTAQIIDRIKGAIDDGSLAPGDRLPSTRALAEEAAVNHLTAVRAYRRLAGEGYVTAGVGRGTFVRSVPPPAANDGDGAWQHAVLPERAQTYVTEVMAETWRIPGDPELLNLAIAWAPPELHPVAELRAMLDGLFAARGADLLRYGNPEGLDLLRDELARRGKRTGFARSADEILVTCGARQAIDLVCRTVLRPGDVVVSESPTFIGALSSLQASGARVLGVPFDEGGLDVDALERILARHEVKLVALQTASQNPTGQDLAADRAQRLVELARERSFYVLEDGVYGTVRFDRREPVRLRQSAPDHVLYVDSVSKTIGGGLRLGWLAASGEVRRRLTDLKLSTDVHTSQLSQHLAQEWLRAGAHDVHLRRINAVYAERCAALLDAVQRRLGDEVEALAPRGGHNLWLTFRRPIDERSLFAEALRQGMSFTPGSAVRPEPSGRSALRLSFSLLDPDRLDEAVRRLAVAVRAVRRQARSWVAAPLS